MASPETSIEVGTETYDVTVSEASGDERERIWNKQKETSPQFSEYEVSAAGRIIPVLILTKK